MKKKFITLMMVGAILTGCGQSETVADNQQSVQESTAAELNSQVEVDRSAEANSNVGTDRFGRFSKVMDNEEPFFCFGWADEEMTLEEYGISIMAEGIPEIKEYTFVDLDGENGEELILYCPQGGSNFLILTEVDGKFYGTSRGYRCFEELQKDGKYLGNGGIGDNYYYTMKIGKDGVTENMFAEQHTEWPEEGEPIDNLVVNGEPVDDLQGWLDQNYSDPAEWIAY